MVTRIRTARRNRRAVQRSLALVESYTLARPVREPVEQKTRG